MEEAALNQTLDSRSSVRPVQAETSLHGALPKRGTHAVPERFQIGVINRRSIDSVLVDRHCFLEPLLTFVQPRQLGAVARKVVRDRPHLRERFRHRRQLIESLLRTLQLVQSEGAMNPTVRPFRRELCDRSGDVYARGDILR